MNCPYCGSRTEDIVKHLQKNDACLKRHRGSIAADLKHVIITYEKDRQLLEEAKPNAGKGE